MVLFCIGLFQRYAPLQVSLSWFGFIYAYLVWELGHFLYHYLAHKVRLLWCLHSTHHAPEDMNLSVTHAHFFLEAPYAETIRTTVCILLGVQPELLFLIMFIDGTYGAFIHIGDNLVKDARFGVLNKIMLTPSHHRVHHARNPLYIDTNFCNLLNVWDRIFGTYQEEDRSLTIDYGINRKMNSGSFLDVYFGEFVALGRDLRAASGLKNKLLYLLMPPGWHPGGEHHTAAVVREQYLNTVGRGI
jgi:sterol desaturase/sphingolipid hydroxylase (fatty acid hydroxylase superfamily)